MRSFLRAPTVAATLAAALSGCGSGATEPDGLAPRVISASVIGVQSHGESVYILADSVGGTSVEGEPELRFALLTSSTQSVVVHRPDGSVRNGSAADIRPGVTVRAWLTGVELRSLPPQYPTTRIDVIAASGG